MLFLVLLLIAAAAGVLVAAVLTSHPQWAWISVALSVVGALLLVVARGRRRAPEVADTGGADSTAADPQGAGGDRDAEDQDSEQAGSSEAPQVGTVREPSQGDPAEEDTDAADALVVSELDTTVVVLDEHPRYHLEECPWLGDGETIPLPVREARDLGFTPCSGCSPDATLAARNRSPG